MTDVELDDRITALEENGGGSVNGNSMDNEMKFKLYNIEKRLILINLMQRGLLLSINLSCHFRNHCFLCCTDILL